MPDSDRDVDAAGATAPRACVAPPPRTCSCAGGAVIEIALNLQDLGCVRFATDPLWEIAASLRVLARPGQHPLHRRLLARVDGAGYDLGLLVDLASVERWLPDLLAPEPVPSRSPEDAALAVSQAHPVLVERDLRVLRGLDPTNPRWRAMRTETFATQVAEALQAYWQQALRPLWSRVTDVVTADLHERAAAVAAVGLQEALGAVHEDVALQGSLLQVRLPGHHRHVRAPGTGVWFVPTVFRWPRLAVQIDTDVPVVAYPARGAGRIWDRRGATPSPLGELVGRSRARILARLEEATTTTRLARELGLAPATVSAHLTAMARAGLLVTAREGKEVRYRRTTLGDALAEVVTGP